METPPNLKEAKDFNESLKFLEKYGVILDSLWIFDKRDNSGAYRKFHHGEFIPQIPRQAILRFTKPYDLVLDPFLGYGTTLVECQRLGRHGIGVEIEPRIASIAKNRIASELNIYGVKIQVVVGDSLTLDFKELVAIQGFKKVDLVVAHPPYHDVITYGLDPHNLCNMPDVESFVEAYGEALDNYSIILKEGGYYILTIGDKYERGSWIPLGFYLLNETLKRPFKLKAICIKNIGETEAKHHKINLWKYRALKGGTNLFKHEYVMIFKKK